MAAWAGWQWHTFIEAQQPSFIERPEGQRASRLETVLGMRIGATTVAQMKAATRFLSCEDRSISVVMIRGLERAAAELEARGENNWRFRIYAWLNPHGRNPQVRFECRLEQGESFGIKGALDEGRMILVHDGPTLPLRHTSIQRTWWNEEATLADLTASHTRLSDDHPGASPVPNPHLAELDGDGPFAELTPYTWEWRWTDLRIELTAIRYAGSRFVVTETIEVPWPVRSDAPQRPPSPEEPLAK